MPRCQSKQALMKGLRPCPQQKIHCAVCTRECIFCDIWKLSRIVFTHVPLSVRYSTTPENLHRISSEPNYDYAAAEQAIEAALNTKAVMLSSIMSICIVEGAEQSQGLRIAHERCLADVKDILYQESILEQTLILLPSPTQYSFPSRSSRRAAHTQVYRDHRRPGMVSMAA